MRVAFNTCSGSRATRVVPAGLAMPTTGDLCRDAHCKIENRIALSTALPSLQFPVIARRTRD